MDAVITRSVQRISPRAVDPTVKNFHWGDLTRGLYEAFDRDARYPILLDADGNVTEGAGYNVFALVDAPQAPGCLRTPVSGALEGITRRTVLELAAEEGIHAEAVALPEAVFRSAAELFATTTAGGVMPITVLDGRARRRGRRRAGHAAPARALLGSCTTTRATPRRSATPRRRGPEGGDARPAALLPARIPVSASAAAGSRGTAAGRSSHG